jgi:NADH-quinone oxidoreductase subunit M
MIPEMGGLARRMPWLATCVYIAGLASLGLPGFSGFNAESHEFLGGFFGKAFPSATSKRVVTIIANASIVVTAVYVLRGLAAVFHGPLTNKKFETLTVAVLSERLSTGILVATLALLGMLPWLFNQLIEGSVLTIVDRLSGPNGLAAF